MRRKPRKILVVDDTEAMRKCAEYYFKEKGFTVLTAESGEEALPIIIEQKPEVMLLDIDLSGMSGIELLKLVREFNNTVKVILMSGHNLDFPNNPQFQRLNIFAFMPKPIDFARLESIIKNALARVKK